MARGDTGYITRTGAVMLGVSFVQILCSSAAVYVGARTAMAFGRDVRAALFHRVGTFSSRELYDIGAPSLITRNTNDVQQVQMLVLMSCTMMAAAPIMMVGGVLMAMRENLGLSWLLAICVPLLFATVAFIISRMVPGFRLMQERIDGVNRILREQITGIRVVRAFVREPVETRRFATANDDLTAVAVNTGRWLATMFPSVMLILNVSSVAVLWFGGHRVDDGTMQIGALDGVPVLPRADPDVGDDGHLHADDGAARRRLCRPHRRGVRHRELRRTGHRARHLPRRPRSARDARSGVQLSGSRHTGAPRPVVDGAARRDDGHHRLHRCRQDDPGQPGAAAVRRHCRRGARRRCRRAPARAGGALEPSRSRPAEGVPVLGHRPQQPAARQAGRDRGRAVAGPRIAQGRDFVEAMPEGLDAPITQGGTNVSGGQRQRLAIARAVVRRPSIYLFDDSFSALDLTTDARLRAALAPVTTDATVVIVAQRVSTIRRADQILVLEDGVVVGRGRHEELLETCETYQQIVQSQLTEEEEAA